MRCIALLFLASLLGGCAAVPDAQDLRAAFAQCGEPVPSGTIIAEVVSIEDHATDLQAPCASNSVCFAPFWHTYRAKVRRVLTGQQLGEEISFATLQLEDYETAVKLRLFVFLTPASPSAQERLKVEFVASRVLFRLRAQNGWGGC